VTSLANFGGRLLVVFDGHCGLCNGWVRWLIRRDRRDRLRFAAFDSPGVAELLERHTIFPVLSAPETILVVQDTGTPLERVLVRSDAVLAVLSVLPRPWPTIAAGLSLFPRLLRDGVYRLVARFRYRLWGRLDSCPVPTPAERGRFL
jgi:predicted DCC family thiol-disulfide oxidoreductase YuxK